MILQPLVENAIQHGLEPSRQGGQLLVSAKRSGQALILTVDDTGRGLEAAAVARRGSAGFGLSYVRDRLSSLYGNQASLVLAPAPQGTGTCVTLRLPLDNTLTLLMQPNATPITHTP